MIAVLFLSNAFDKFSSIMACTDEAKHTAAFLDKMDCLFNAFNSRSTSSTSQMSHAMSETSGHKEFLTETLSWLKTIKTKGEKFILNGISRKNLITDNLWTCKYVL